MSPLSHVAKAAVAQVHLVIFKMAGLLSLELGGWRKYLQRKVDKKIDRKAMIKLTKKVGRRAER